MYIFGLFRGSVATFSFFLLLSLFLIILHLFCDCFVSLLHPIWSHLLFCVYVLCHLWLFCIFLRSFFIHSSQSDFSVRNKNPRPKNILDRRTNIQHPVKSILWFALQQTILLWMEQWEQWILHNGQTTMMKAVTASQSDAVRKVCSRQITLSRNEYSSWLALVATDLIWQGSAQNNPSERLIWPIHVCAELVFW